MENDNETISDIVYEMREGVVADGWMEQTLREFADRIEKAEKQSVTNCNRLENAAKMREALENIAEYAKAAACHAEDAHLLGYLNQIESWAEDALYTPPRNCDRISDAVIQSLRDKKLEMAGEIAAKEAEVSALRALVKELADIVDAPLCNQDCSKCPPDTRCASKKLRALVARASEVIRKDKTNDAY